jgi:hypothetical protein
MCDALLQLSKFFRCRHRSRDGGKDEGEEREEYPGELIHRDVEVRKIPRDGERGAAEEEGLDDWTEE